MHEASATRPLARIRLAAILDADDKRSGIAAAHLDGDGNGVRTRQIDHDGRDALVERGKRLLRTVNPADGKSCGTQQDVHFRPFGRRATEVEEEFHGEKGLRLWA